MVRGPRHGSTQNFLVNVAFCRYRTWKKLVDTGRTVRRSEPRKRGEWIHQGAPKTPVEPFNHTRPGFGHLPTMKNLQPILFTVAVVVGTLVLVFRFAPTALRKVIVGGFTP